MKGHAKRIKTDNILKEMTAYHSFIDSNNDKKLIHPLKQA